MFGRDRQPKVPRFGDFKPAPRDPGRPRYGQQQHLHDPGLTKITDDGEEVRKQKAEEGVVGHHRIAGLDLGQAVDWTALVGISRRKYRHGFQGPHDPSWSMFGVARVKRVSYPEMCRKLLANLQAEMLVVDFTGVGRPVVDILREEARRIEWSGRIVPVSIVGSNAKMERHTEARGYYWTVPKVDIVTSINVAQQKHGLRIPDKGEGKLILEEMDAFQMRKQPGKVSDQFSARQGAHDDLLLALGLACWWMTRFGNRELSVFLGPDAADMERAWKPYNGPNA